MLLPVLYDHKTLPQNTPRDSTFVLGLLQTILAALALVLACLTLAIGMIRLRKNYRRYSRRQLQHEFVFELEAQLPQVRVLLSCSSK